MPRKIENPLRSGLPAKMYMELYLDGTNGYSLAKKVYHIQQGIPPTGKIYAWLNKMEELGIIEKTAAGYKVSIKLLIEEIDSELQKYGIILNSEEKRRLGRILSSYDFRRYIEGFYKRFEPHIEIDFGDMVEREVKEFDALQMIMETVGMVSTTCFIKRKFKVNPVSPSTEVTKQFTKIVKEPKSSDFQQIQKGIELLTKVEQEFMISNIDFLAKLSKLWPQSRDILYSCFVTFYNEQTKTKEDKK